MSPYVAILTIIICVNLSIAFPAEKPMKFSLDRMDANRQVSKLVQGQLIASEAQNNVVSVLASKEDAFNQGRSALESLQGSSIANIHPAPTRETVRLETEEDQALLEKRPEKPVERVLENFLRPTPLVDGIREEEKYGNNGDKFIGIGRALVGGFEGFSNFLNAIVDFPVNAAKKTSRGITEALNHLGARIVGLE